MIARFKEGRGSRHKSMMKLKNGSRIAVIGGGPAGSYFSIFLLGLAQRTDLDLKLDIYEPRDFSLPAPQGCNMCGGVISETLVQNLATEGINLPGAVVQKAINAYVLHTDTGTQRIEAASPEKRIGTVFRGGGPRGMDTATRVSFDRHLLSLAERKGAAVIRARAVGVERSAGQMEVRTREQTTGGYDLVAVATGINTTASKLFNNQDSSYKPPKTTKTAIYEYFLGKELVENHFGDSLHVFLLDIPRLDFGMIVPKGDYVSICLLGKDIDQELIEGFLTSPEIQSCFPATWRWDEPGCHCMPRINVKAAEQPYGDRIVYIGDSGVTRLYKDGIGAAYRAAKVAATCAVLEGVSAEDFRRYFEPFCRKMSQDNQIGKLIFTITHIVQRVGLFRRAVVHMVGEEQTPGSVRRMSNVLWDVFTGSTSYRDIFLRTLHPIFISRFFMSVLSSVVNK